MELDWGHHCGASGDWKVSNGIDMFYFFFSPPSETETARRNKAKAQRILGRSHDPRAFAALFDRKKWLQVTRSRPLATREDKIRAFWINWFAAFGTVEKYESLEGVITDQPDSLSKRFLESQNALKNASSVSPGAHAKQARYWEVFRVAYNAHAKFFCYYRTMFYYCNTLGYKRPEVGRSCPFMINKSAKEFRVFDDLIELPHSQFGGKAKPKAKPKPKAKAKAKPKRR